MGLGNAGFALLGVGIFFILLFIFLVIFTDFNGWYIVLLLFGIAFTIYGFTFGVAGTALSDPNVTKAIATLI